MFTLFTREKHSSFYPYKISPAAAQTLEADS